MAGKGKARKARKRKKKKAIKAAGQKRPHPSAAESGSKRANMDQNLNQQLLEEKEKQVKELQAELTLVSKKCNKYEIERADLGRTFRNGKKNKGKKDWDRGVYTKLWAVRRTVREFEKDISLKQRKLADLRAELFRMQALKLNKTDRPQETIEQKRIQKTIIDSFNSQKPLGVIGIDPGIVVAATAVTTTFDAVMSVVRRYTTPPPPEQQPPQQTTRCNE
ncbi:hypothetical protein BJV82DRAFT_668734 [Fennellomyces sp. T-0311]|nr:hypothetical protein BJV82DRAFT_668734 [Fennellomyces sp. T-0311]